MPSSSNYLSLSLSSPNTVSLSVDASKVALNPTNYGNFPFTLTVNSSLKYGGVSAAVLSKDYKFNVIVTCTVTNLSFSTFETISDVVYVLTYSAITTNAVVVTQVPACNYPLTYTPTYQKTGVSFTMPSSGII